MYVKVMSGENVPDGWNAKEFRLFADVAKVGFYRGPAPAREPYADITFRDGTRETVEPAGNTYVMDDHGKTIESFAFSPPPDFGKAGD